MKRIFIVGLARSGTTLLQSMLGNHQEVFSLPETHFFSKTIPKQPILRYFSTVKSYHKNHVTNYLKEIGYEHLYHEYAMPKYNLNQWTSYLIQIIDSIAAYEKKNIWVEKTPLHLHYIDIIKKNTTNCYFLHLAREPIANIAALLEVGRKYPGQFQQNSLKKAYNRYVNETAITSRKIKSPDNILIHYEDLVSQPTQTLENICDFTNIPFQKSMLNHSEMVRKISSADEKWKNPNHEKLQLKDKVLQRLTQEEINWLEEKLEASKNPIIKHYVK